MVIMRLWYGCVLREKRDVYECFLIERVVLDYSFVEGFLKFYFMRWDEEKEIYFLFVMIWDLWEFIKKFVGENLELVKYYLEDDEFLFEKEKYV